MLVRTEIPSIAKKVIGSIAIVGLLAATGIVTVDGQPARAANPDRGPKWANEGEPIPAADYHRPAGSWSEAETRPIDVRAAIYWHRSAAASGAWPWGAWSGHACWLVPGAEVSALRLNSANSATSGGLRQNRIGAAVPRGGISGAAGEAFF